MYYYILEKGEEMIRIKSLTLGILVLIGVSLLILSGCQSETVSTVDKKISIPEGELDPAVWGKAFPVQYESYLKNNEINEEVSQFVKQPLLTELFKGYGFSIEYNETKGHTSTLSDVRKIKRVNNKTTGSCMTCKSAEVPGMIEEMGIKYYSTPFTEINKKAKHPISCSDCHDAKTMDLKVTRPAFVKAMDRKGIDITKATKQEMRTYVCAQCHVEYYFDTQTKEVIYPWDNGYTPDDIEKYYNDKKFSDWEHPDSKAKMLKAQHPEFETWQSGTHGSAGVGCSDCHMPYEKEGKKKYTSHTWTSPLKTIDRSCAICHDQGTEWLENRVDYIQKKTDQATLDAEKASDEAHKAVQKALATPGSDQKLIKEAQELIVKGQWRWDFVSAENSSGFHNPELSIETLLKSIDYSRQAQLLAEKALKK